MTKPASVLVVAAHPDDEALGCGGTVAKWTAAGVAVHVAFIADGVSSRDASSTQAGRQELETRREAARQACKILSTSEPFFGDIPDNRADTVALLDIVRIVESLVERHRPDTVLTHHFGDLNVDHRCVHQAVMTACRPQQGHPVRTVLCFEVPSSTEWQAPGQRLDFSPNWFEDISATLEVKLQALQAYSGEIRAWPHPRSLRAVEALARWRGATAGCDAAEAFMLGRQLQ